MSMVAVTRLVFKSKAVLFASFFISGAISAGTSSPHSALVMVAVGLPYASTLTKVGYGCHMIIGS